MVRAASITINGSVFLVENDFDLEMKKQINSIADFPIINNPDKQLLNDEEAFELFSQKAEEMLGVKFKRINITDVFRINI
jgi:hypothetical protein